MNNNYNSHVITWFKDITEVIYDLAYTQGKNKIIRGLIFHVRFLEMKGYHFYYYAHFFTLINLAYKLLYCLMPSNITMTPSYGQFFSIFQNLWCRCYMWRRPWYIITEFAYYFRVLVRRWLDLEETLAHIIFIFSLKTKNILW